jgi:Galactose oxidase-like, Early set domain/Glyoxal oxidase N-terminus/Kelch motif
MTNVSGHDGRSIDRRRFLAVGGTAAAVLSGFPARLLAADPAVTGSWTAPFNLGLVSIHAVLLHTGNVLLFSWPNNTVGSDAVLWNPATGRTTNIALTYQRDIFCSGTTVLSDGRVFIAGGHIWQGAISPTQGVINTTIFDPASNAWTEGPLMSQARWYPTTTLLGNGTVIICGGTINTGTNAINVDRYNPVTNTLNRLPATADKAMVTYPRVKLTTGGLLVWTNSPTTYYLDPATATWTTGPKLESGTRSVTDMSVLLPGLTEILEAGGTLSSGVTSTADLLSLSARQPAWAYTSAMHFARQWANSVLLPDGTVLVVGGGTSGYYDGPVLTPEIYHPATRTWTEMAAQTAPRMYHSTALLLPDGRVLSAGQSSGKYENTGEIFSPPYLFKGARPAITSAPATLGYRAAFTITSPQAASVARVVLIKPGAVTHSCNFDQRYIPCTFTARGTTLSAVAPSGANSAPPGWYLLFLVSTAGVPSVASWVHVG